MSIFVTLTKLCVVKREFMDERHEIQKLYWEQNQRNDPRTVMLNDIPQPILRSQTKDKEVYRWEIPSEDFLYVVDMTIQIGEGTVVSSIHCYDGDDEVDSMALEFWVTYTAKRF